MKLDVNKRILAEIDKLAADEQDKSFLREILEFELENIDKEMSPYTQEYKNCILKIYK
jgi:hypothetical protein